MQRAWIPESHCGSESTPISACFISEKLLLCQYIALGESFVTAASTPLTVLSVEAQEE